MLILLFLEIMSYIPEFLGYLNCPRNYYYLIDQDKYITEKQLLNENNIIIDKLNKLAYINKRRYDILLQQNKYNFKTKYNLVKFITSNQILNLDTLQIVSKPTNCKFSSLKCYCCSNNKTEYNHFIAIYHKIQQYYDNNSELLELYQLFSKRPKNKCLNLDTLKYANRKNIVINDSNNSIISSDYTKYIKFINYLLFYGEQHSNIIVEPTYTKNTISVAKKNEIWHTYCENIFEACCMCCYKNKITANSFAAGHVKSEVSGGTLHIDNLRPICNSCNSSMANQNMFVWLEKQQLPGWYQFLIKEPIMVYLNINPMTNINIDNYYHNYQQWLKQYNLVAVNKQQFYYTLLGMKLI